MSTEVIRRLKIMRLMKLRYRHCDDLEHAMSQWLDLIGHENRQSLRCVHYYTSLLP